MLDKKIFYYEENYVKKNYFYWSIFCLNLSLFCLAGDTIRNGSVDIVDALATAQYTIGIIASGFDTSVADVNDNDFIDIVDALMIAQYYVDIIPYFPVSEVKELPVPWIEQNSPIYCGPAAALMYTGYQRSKLGSSGGSLPNQAVVYHDYMGQEVGDPVGVNITQIRDGVNGLIDDYTTSSPATFTRFFSTSATTTTDSTHYLAQLELMQYNYEPSIVIVDLGTTFHYLVFKGTNRVTNSVLYNDPIRVNPRDLTPLEWIDFSYCNGQREFVAHVPN